MTMIEFIFTESLTPGCYQQPGVHTQEVESPMQDHYAPAACTLDAGAQVIVHPRLIDWLRRATYAEIGSAAEALDEAAFANDREAHPERFRATAQSLRESYALLDTIGWAQTDPPTAVPLDLDKDSWTLIRALDGAQEFADEETYEISRDTDGQALTDEHNRAGKLHNLIDEVRQRVDMLAVQETAQTIPDIAA
jgi:hypothetical protein